MTDAATWRSNYERQTHLLQPAIRLKRDADQTVDYLHLDNNVLHDVVCFGSAAAAKSHRRLQTAINSQTSTSCVGVFLHVQRSRHPFVRKPRNLHEPSRTCGRDFDRRMLRTFDRARADDRLEGKALHSGQSRASPCYHNLITCQQDSILELIYADKQLELSGREKRTIKRRI